MLLGIRSIWWCFGSMLSTCSVYLLLEALWSEKEDFWNSCIFIFSYFERTYTCIERTPTHGMREWTVARWSSNQLAATRYLLKELFGWALKWSTFSLDLNMILTTFFVLFLVKDINDFRPTMVLVPFSGPHMEQSLPKMQIQHPSPIEAHGVNAQLNLFGGCTWR